MEKSVIVRIDHLEKRVLLRTIHLRVHDNAGSGVHDLAAEGKIYRCREGDG